MTTKGMSVGQITDEGVAKLRSLIGVNLRRTRYNESATKDTIRHYCHGIGDTNPLYCDPTYASQSRFGGIIAPPMFLNSVWWPAGGGMGLPGVHGFHSGNDWKLYKAIHLGDTISVSERLVNVVEKPSKFGGRTVIQYAEATYRNQRDEVVATALSWSVRAERKAAKERGKYAEITRATYTPEQLKAIADTYDAEVVRGAQPRYWEDVTEGEELTPVVKGPLNMTDMMAFVSGTLGGAALGRGGAHGIGHRYRQRHPAWSYVDPETGAADAPEMVHVGDGLAQEVGVPLAYDYGCQRLCWHGHMLGNWMGDDGFLKRLYVELRLFNMVGDTTWCKGRVKRKYVEGGEHLVECEIWAENQRGQVTAPGWAVVALPSRSV